MEIYYLFFACCGLAIFALILYWFFPSLRKNSFQLEISEEEKQDLKKSAVNFVQLITGKTSLEERYATELANGEAILIKGTNNAEKTSFVRIIISIVFLVIVISIIFGNDFIFFPIENYLPKCLLKLDDGGIVLFIIGYLFIFLQDGISNIKEDIKSIQLGRKTGWNGDINKEYPHDTIIFKYNKKFEREYIQHIIFIVLFYGGLIAILFASLFYFSDFDTSFSSCFA